MSHAVNVQSLLEALVQLEHIAVGSREVCRNNGIASFEESGYLDPLSIRTLTKQLVCDALINVAIKGRIVMDHVHANDRGTLERIEKQVLVGLRISHDAVGNEQLSLRESFNKVVHAKQVSVEFSESETDPDNTYFWDGQVLLTGDQYNKQWSHWLVVDQWSRAGRRFIMQLLREDRLSMLGWDGGF